MTLVAERPVPPRPRPWRFPRISRDGRVVASDVPGRPLAVAALVLDAGASTEPHGRQGIGRVLASALTQGTSRLDAFEFAVATERLGAQIRADVDWDSLRVSVEAPVDRLAAGVELMAQMVRTPALDSATLARVRAERLDEITMEQTQPASRASAEFARQVFAPSSRYAYPSGGDLDGVAASGEAEIRRLASERLRPTLATLVVAGDLARVDLADLEQRVFDGWTGGGAGPVPVDVTAKHPRRRIVVVDRPGSVQSVILAGHPGPPRDIPDYVATTTMAMVLGGMFTSRLNLRLREERGFTYGAFAGFHLRRHAGTFTARAAVATEVTAAALADLVAEIERTARDGVTPAERDEAVAFRAGVWPVNFSGVHPIAHALGDLVVHGWPVDYFDRLREEISTVTTEDLCAAAAARLHPEELVMVVVGDAERVTGPLGSAGLGPVAVVPDT